MTDGSRAGSTPDAGTLLSIDSGSTPDAGTLIASSELASTLALTPSAVYWSTDTEIVSLAFNTGSPSVLAQNQLDPIGIAADERSVYWANAGGYPASAPPNAGQILSMPLNGGPVTTLATDLATPQAMTIDGANVYWTGSTPTDGGAFLSEGSVMAIPLQGGQPTALASGLTNPGALAVQGGLVVFATAPSELQPIVSQIEEVSVTGGPVTVLATTDRMVSAIAVDDTTVYWIDAPVWGIDSLSASARLRSVPLAGGAPSSLLGTELNPQQVWGGPAGLALSDTTLFIGENGTTKSPGDPQPPADGQIWSFSLVGSTAAPVVGGLSGVTAMAVDANHLAWLSPIGSTGDLQGIYVLSR